MLERHPRAASAAVRAREKRSLRPRRPVASRVEASACSSSVSTASSRSIFGEDSPILRESTSSRTTASVDRWSPRPASRFHPRRKCRASTGAELRELFAEHVGVAAGRYGALIADEAQDFHEDWWLPLQLLLEDPDASPLYVFFDDNQRIFPVPKNLPVRDEPYQLTRNCRNTQAINKLVNAFYKGGTIRALGPPGTPLDPHFYETESRAPRTARPERSPLDRGGRCLTEDIALLTPKAAHRSALWRVDSLGGAPLTDDPWTPGVLRTSIYKFKGLERLVVGVVELEGVRDEVFYVGFSRPNVFLSIFAPESAREKLQRVLRG